MCWLDSELNKVPLLVEKTSPRERPRRAEYENRTTKTHPCSRTHGSLKMRRPTFLVAEPEPEQALSSRKLLLETYKFNVITAHSEQEMFEMLDVFPKVDAVILHDDTPGRTTHTLVPIIRERVPDTKVVALSPTGNRQGRLADHVVSSHDPEALLHLLQELFGDARRIDANGQNFPGDEG